MTLYPETLTCPWCGRRTVLHRDGIFQWRKCTAPVSCGWDVFQTDADKQRRAAK